MYGKQILQKESLEKHKEGLEQLQKYDNLKKLIQKNRNYYDQLVQSLEKIEAKIKQNQQFLNQKYNNKEEDQVKSKRNKKQDSQYNDNIYQKQGLYPILKENDNQQHFNYNKYRISKKYISFYEFEQDYHGTPCQTVLDMVRNQQKKSRLIEIYNTIQSSQSIQDQLHHRQEMSLSKKEQSLIQNWDNKINEHLLNQSNTHFEEQSLLNDNNRKQQQQQQQQKQKQKHYMSKKDLQKHRVLEQIIDIQSINENFFPKNIQNEIEIDQNILKNNLKNINWIKLAYYINHQMISQGHIYLQVTGLDIFKFILQKLQFRQKKSMWAQEEDDELKKLVEIYGEKHWGQIANYFEGRFFNDVQQRWQKYLNGQIYKGRWKVQDDVKIGVLVEVFSEGNSLQNVQWSRIIPFFRNRTDIQIRERWCNLLDPGLKMLRWTREEEAQLVQVTQDFNGKWARIAEKFGNKTDNQCLRKWKLLVGKKNNLRQLYQLQGDNLKKEMFQCIKIGRLRNFIVNDLKNPQRRHYSEFINGGQIQKKLPNFEEFSDKIEKEILITSDQQENEEEMDSFLNNNNKSSSKNKNKNSKGQSKLKQKQKQKNKSEKSQMVKKAISKDKSKGSGGKKIGKSKKKN